MGYAQRLNGRPKLGRKVVIGYPVGGSVTLAFHASMLNMCEYEVGKSDLPLFKETARLISEAMDELPNFEASYVHRVRERLRALLEIHTARLASAEKLYGRHADLYLELITHVQGLDVADNRDLLVLRALKTDADWLLQIDTDIAFPPTLIGSLLDVAGDDKKIVAASVPLGPPIATTGYMRTNKHGIWANVPQVRETMEVDGVATAVCLVHRSVYEDIAARHGQCWHHHVYVPLKPGAETKPGDFAYISNGEDLSFSLRAKEAGHRIWVTYIPGLKHYKTQALTHDYERTIEKAAEADNLATGELVQEGAA